MNLSIESIDSGTTLSINAVFGDSVFDNPEDDVAFDFAIFANPAALEGLIYEGFNLRKGGADGVGFVNMSFVTQR